jgi:ParB family chromosome partitioning protein
VLTARSRAFNTEDTEVHGVNHFMTTSAAEKVAGRPVEKKKEEKVEKRRALGRGLASLLPGPRVVAEQPSAVSHQPSAIGAPSGAADVTLGGKASGESKIPRFARDDKDVFQDDSGVGGQASQELQATRTGVSDPRGTVPDQYSTQLPSPPFAKDAKDGAPYVEATSGLEEQADEVISIQAVADDRVVGNRVAHIPIELIVKNPYQTRYVFDEEALWELRDSIKEHGVVQPVVVRPAEEEGRYILVLGERRLRASKMAEKETIPALVRRLSPQQAAEMTVLENVMREDLNPIEQAEAFRVLSLEFKLTQEQIADRIGMSRETVSNYMRLLRLPRKVMDYMLSERLSFSDAREILRLEDDQYIEAVAEEVVTHQLKWDQIEDRVMRINGSFVMLPGQTLPGQKKKTGGGARWMDPNVRAAQTDMERTLGMRVRIRDRHGKGKIVIEYASVDDYERVTTLLRSKK